MYDINTKNFKNNKNIYLLGDNYAKSKYGCR